MITSIPFANAATVVAVGLYVVCRVLFLAVPDFLYSVAQSWFHTISIESMQATAPLDFGAFILGGISLAVVTWVTVYAFAEIYNRLLKK